MTLCFITQLPSYYRVNTYLTIFYGSEVCWYWCKEDKANSHRRHGIKLCKLFNCKFIFMRVLFRYPHFLSWTVRCMIEYIPLYIFWLSQHQSALFYSTLPPVANQHSTYLLSHVWLGQLFWNWKYFYTHPVRVGYVQTNKL